MKSNLPSIAKTKLPNPNKDQCEQAWYYEKKRKETLHTIQCSIQLAIFEYQMCYSKAFYQTDCSYGAAFLNLLLRTRLMICVPIEISLLDIDARL